MCVARARLGGLVRPVHAGVGAPPSLVAGAQRAGLDEIEHARLSFALAATALGRPVGPSALALEGVALASDVGSFAAALVREGCVGETLAAVDAAERLRGATDPAVRSVLATIVVDESRHAALAWATLGWLLQRHPELRPHLAAVFAAEVARLPRLLGESTSGEGLSHGLLTTSERSRALQDGWRAVVEPAWLGLAAEGSA